MPTSRPLWQQVLLVMSALAVLVSLGAVAAYQVDYQTEVQDLREETSRLAAFVTVHIKDQVQRQGTSEATVASVSGLFGRLPLPDGSLLTLTDKDSRILARSVDADRYVGTLTQGDASAARPPSSLPPVEQRVGLDGIERLFAHGLIPEGPWVLSVGIPVSVARARTSPSIPLVAFGTMALVLALLLQSAALALALAHGAGLAALAVAVVSARLGLTWACTPRWRPARPDGLGATVAQSTTALGASLLSVALLCLAGALGWLLIGNVLGGLALAVGVIAALLAAYLVCRTAERRLGGVTGDVLGAAVEWSTTASLVASAILMSLAAQP